ncbi:MAG: Type secretion cytoplasmic protein [Herminiimonas sp.]|nr:Type secretion cytoplasmic protein [Herminiimonas sp.]
MVFIIRNTEELSRPDTSAKVVKARDFWAYKQAEDAVAEGMRRHEEIIDSAQAAYVAEQQRGYREGTETAKLEQTGNMIEIVGHTVEYFSKIENKMVDLVLDAVRRIVSDFDDRERIITVVRNSLVLVRSQKHLILRVHPSQVEAVRSQLGSLQESYPTIALIEVVGDSSRKIDECQVESDIGTVEASMSGQLDTLRETFRNVFGAQAGTLGG